MSSAPQTLLDDHSAYVCTERLAHEWGVEPEAVSAAVMRGVESRRRPIIHKTLFAAGRANELIRVADVEIVRSNLGKRDEYRSTNKRIGTGSRLYVIGSEGSPLVKVGHTTKKPKDQLSILQRGSAARLVWIWHGAPGTGHHEKHMHEVLADAQVHLEWFRASAVCAAMVDAGRSYDAAWAIDNWMSAHDADDFAELQGVATSDIVSPGVFR